MQQVSEAGQVVQRNYGPALSLVSDDREWVSLVSQLTGATRPQLHNHCASQVNPECHLGQHRDHILAPTSIVPIVLVSTASRSLPAASAQLYNCTEVACDHTQTALCARSISGIVSAREGSFREVPETRNRAASQVLARTRAG